MPVHRFYVNRGVVIAGRAYAAGDTVDLDVEERRDASGRRVLDLGQVGDALQHEHLVMLDYQRQNESRTVEGNRRTGGRRVQRSFDEQIAEEESRPAPKRTPRKKPATVKPATPRKPAK